MIRRIAIDGVFSGLFLTIFGASITWAALGCATLNRDFRAQDNEHARLERCLFLAGEFPMQTSACEEQARQRCLSANREPDCAIDWTAK